MQQIANTLSNFNPFHSDEKTSSKPIALEAPFFGCKIAKVDLSSSLNFAIRKTYNSGSGLMPKLWQGFSRLYNYSTNNTEEARRAKCKEEARIAKCNPTEEISYLKHNNSLLTRLENWRELRIHQFLATSISAAKAQGMGSEYLKQYKNNLKFKLNVCYKKYEILSHASEEDLTILEKTIEVVVKNKLNSLEPNEAKLNFENNDKQEPEILACILSITLSLLQ